MRCKGCKLLKGMNVAKYSMVSDTAVDVAHKTIGVIILLIGLSLFCIGVTNVVWKAGLELEPPIPL